MGGEAFREERELFPSPFQKGLLISSFLPPRQTIEGNRLPTANKHEVILHHPPAPLRPLNTIYFKQMKMCFRVAGSSQLKGLKAEKLLQQKYLSFSSWTAVLPPLLGNQNALTQLFLAVGTEWKILLFLLQVFFLSDPRVTDFHIFSIYIMYMVEA